MINNAIPEPPMEMFEIKGEPAEARNARETVLSEFSDLEFYPDGHIYLLHGNSLNSVSGIGHRYESRPFDTEFQATRYAGRHGETAQYWMQVWECNSFRATTLGTKTHEFGESLAYLKAGHPEFIRPLVASQYLEKFAYLAPIHKKEEAVEKFLGELPSCYHLVLNEARVYSGKNPIEDKNLKEQICGTFDMLYYYDGEGDPTKAGYVIFDYKTNENLYSDYNRSNGIMLLPPFGHLYEESLGEYAIQLSLYALMLQDIGLNVIDRRIVWLKSDGEYEIIPVPDLVATLRTCL